MAVNLTDEVFEKTMDRTVRDMIAGSRPGEEVRVALRRIFPHISDELLERLLGAATAASVIAHEDMQNVEAGLGTWIIGLESGLALGKAAG